MHRLRFEELVARAVEELPDDFRNYLENVDVVVEDWPTTHHRAAGRTRRDETLLGLYEGVPQLDRGSNYGMVAPDKISIFQKPIEALCRDDELAIAQEISRVVRHEIAHHFGIGDTRLRELEGE